MKMILVQHVLGVEVTVLNNYELVVVNYKLVLGCCRLLSVVVGF